MMTYTWVTALLAIAFLFPNSQQILAQANPVLEASVARSKVVPSGSSTAALVGMATLSFMGSCHRMRGLYRRALDYTGQRIPLLAILI